MRIKHRFTILAVIVLGVLAAISYGLYRASQQVPQFYLAEISVPPITQEAASDLMLRQATILYSASQQRGRWGQVFKAATVNGWLAIDLPRNHPDLLPSGMHDPRVHIGPEGISIACQLDRGGFHGVILLQVSAFIESDDVIGLQIHKARLGAIPWSLDRILKGISDAAQQSNVRIRWRQINGDPVALITIPPISSDRKKVLHIDAIKLEEGQLAVTGTTEITPK